MGSLEKVFEGHFRSYLSYEYIMHLLDTAESDIRFVVQIELDVGRSEACESME